MLATKFASSNSAHTIHAPRARASHFRGTRTMDGREVATKDFVPGGNMIVYSSNYAYKSSD